MTYFINHSNTRREDKDIFAVAESRSILYSNYIFYLQIDMFTEYNGIAIEH